MLDLINFIEDLSLDNIWLKSELGFLFRMYKTGLSYLLRFISLQYYFNETFEQFTFFKLD